MSGVRSPRRGPRYGKCHACGRWAKRSLFDKTENWALEERNGRWVEHLAWIIYHCKAGPCAARQTEATRVWYRERTGEEPNF